MNSFEVYVMYLSLKRHFSDPKYDYFKYNKKIKVKVSTFEKRKDKFFFQRLSKHPNLEAYFVGNCVKNPDFWIGSLVENESNYNEYIKRIQGLSYWYKEEIASASSGDLMKLIVVPEKEHPLLLKEVVADRVSYPSLVIFTTIFPLLFNYWESFLQKDDIIFNIVKLKTEKLRPFIKFSKSEFKTITKNIFQNASDNGVLKDK